MPSNAPRPEAVLRGHAGEVQALDFDAAERFLVSGDSLGEVRVWGLDDLRPAAVRRLHPLSGGILSLRLFRSAGRQLLGTQGRDGATHLWACDNEMVLSEDPVRSFVRDCYSFCRFSVLAPEPPPASQQADRQAGSSEAQQREQEQQQADEFVAAVLGDGDEPAAAGGDAAASAADEPAAAAGGREAAGRADGGSSGASAPSCSAAAAIWGLHPCPQASAEQPPALLAIPGGDERTAEIVCCACGARLAEFREQAAGRKLGMLMAVQLYCLPSAAAPAARGTAGDVACGAAAPSAPAGGGGGGSPSASGGSSSDAPPAAPSPRVCLAAGYEDGSLVLWDAAAPRAPLAQRQLCKEPVMALALHPSPCSPTGGACGSAEDAVAVFKLDHASCPAKIGIRHSIELRKEGIGDAAVRPDGKLLVTAGWDGRVRAYKYRSGRALAILKYHTSPVTGLRFAPRSMLLATAARDGTLALWPLYQPGTERQ